ncbi:MAG: Crp/Fnr family transcriptional regulator [Coriobacteriia bacterium]|nr:Crp/Fnr family transcriptional regulator [Coriobacteriia bacterium]
MLGGIPHSYPDGHVFFTQGDGAADLYIIKSGFVRIVRETREGEVELAVLATGDFFGEMGLFAPGPRSATATAVGDVRVEVVDRPGFIAIVDEPMVLQMLDKMSRRLRRMDETLGGAPSNDDSATGEVLT